MPITFVSPGLMDVELTIAEVHRLIAQTDAPLSLFGPSRVLQEARAMKRECRKVAEISDAEVLAAMKECTDAELIDIGRVLDRRRMNAKSIFLEGRDEQRGKVGRVHRGSDGSP